MGEEDKSAAATTTGTCVRFHYIKNGHFRAIHVDGAIGGLSPNGNIHCSVYSERSTIPQVTEHAATENGQLSQQVVIEGKAGVVREIDANLVMSLPVAVELRDWLSARIKEYEDISKKIKG